MTSPFSSLVNEVKVVIEEVEEFFGKEKPAVEAAVEAAVEVEVTAAAPVVPVDVVAAPVAATVTEVPVVESASTAQLLQETPAVAAVAPEVTVTAPVVDAAPVANTAV